MKTLELKYEPRGPQLEVHCLMAEHRFGVVVAHRRLGKTVCAVMALIYAALSERRDDGRYAYIAPYYKQAKQNVWDMFKKWLVGFPVKFSEAELRIDFSNGSRISLYGADNPDAIRGVYFDGVVLDELADMRPKLWDEVVRPTLSDRLGWAFFIGTPKGVDMFYDMYQKALETPGWFARSFPASSTGIIDANELETAKREMSPSAYAREYECDFAAGRDDVVIPASVALAASEREIHERDVKGAVSVLGVDVARYGDDSSVIFPVRGLKAYEPLRYRKVSNVELANIIMGQMSKFDPDYVRIDAGRGEGVIDILRSHGHRVTEVNFGGRPRSVHYANARAEMWHGMRQWLENGGCIPKDPDLITDLSAPTYIMNQRNKMQVESKESMRLRGVRSTDLGDALALAVGVPLMHTVGGSGRKLVAKGVGLSSVKGFSLRRG